MTRHRRHGWIIIGYVLLLSMFGSNKAIADLRFHWEDRFTAAEKQKLTTWLTEVHAALEKLTGRFAMDVHLYLHRRPSREPVPWAHTERSHRQGVHFHVDPSFSLNEFKKDWTAPHELSHLVLPYVGRSNAWFGEGFASFMQYQVMHEMGVLSRQAMAKRYTRHLERAERNYSHADRPFSRAASSLRAQGKYPTLYWGGAAYFLQVNDALLSERSSGLIGVLKTYQGCCRRNRSDLDTLTAQLDRLAGGTVFSDRLSSFRSKPGFPAYRRLSMIGAE